MHAASAQSDPAFPATQSVTSPSGTTPATSAAPGVANNATAFATPSQLRAASSLQPFTGNTAAGSGQSSDSASSLAPTLDRAPRNWTITPSLGLGEEYTSNVLASGVNGRGYDFVTLVQPSISASGTTTRLQGSLSYHPEIDIYARNFGQSQVNQNFGGSVLATLLPGTVFLDLRAYGGVTTNGTGSTGGTSGTSTANSNDQTQSLAFSVSPYALRRFGDWGTGEVGVSLQRSSTSAANGANNTTVLGSTTNPYFTSGNQDLTSYGAHAGFQTGEALGRYNGTVLASLNQGQGSGVLANSARDTFTIDNGYGVTRLFTLLGRVGYEHIRYSGTTPIRIDDEIWNLGFRLTLGPASSVEIRYGHQDGFNSLLFKAAVQPTARTQIFASYSEGLDTDAEQLQNTLATSDFDQLGNPVDHTSGAPLLLSTTGFFGAQNNLYRTQRFSLTGTLLEPVDLFTVTVNAENNTLVSSSGLPNSLGSNKGIYGSINWSHSLSPTLSLSSFAQYGVREAQQAGTERVFTGSISLAKALSETLSAQLRYSYNRTSGGQGFATQGFINQGFVTQGFSTQTSNSQALSNYDQSLILLSATKSF